MDSQRYDHVMMGDHVGQQQNLVNHMIELQKKAIGVLNHLQTVWTAHGSNAYAQCSMEINQAFQTVFDTINRHAAAIGTSSHNAGAGDQSVAGMFKAL